MTTPVSRKAQPRLDGRTNRSRTYRAYYAAIVAELAGEPTAFQTILVERLAFTLLHLADLDTRARLRPAEARHAIDLRAIMQEQSRQLGLTADAPRAPERVAHQEQLR